MKLRNVVGYEGYYQVSDCGNVFRVGRKNPLKKHIQSTGKYHTVALSLKGKVKTFRVHRLVAEAFILNPENKPQVNHINCDTFDNKVENLEWVTASENCKHSYDNGRNKPPVNFLGKFGSEHNKSKEFWFKHLDGSISHYGSGLEFTRETGFDHTAISFARGKKEERYAFTKGKMKGCEVYFTPHFENIR